MSFIRSKYLQLGSVLLAVAIWSSGCKKKPAPEPPPPPSAVSVNAEPAAAPPPQAAAAETAAAPMEATPAFEKMTPEDKYWMEMGDSITSFIQDHLRNKGRMPKDAKDVVDLKIMSRVDVPPNYTLVIDQKT